MNDRILASCIFAFITGLAVCATAGACVYMLVPVFILIVCIKAVSDKNPGRLISLAVLIAAGMIAFTTTEIRVDEDVCRFENKYVEVCGTVTRPPKPNGDMYVMTVKQEKIERAGKTYKSGGNILVYVSDRAELRAGDRIEVSGKYQRPQENRNDGGFNYRKYLKTDDIRATMFVSKSRVKFVEYSPTPGTYAFVFSQKLGNKITSYISGEEGELVRAVVLGDKEGFTDEMKNNFSDCGISHIVAVSGMHMSILIMFIMNLGMIFGIKRKLRAISAIAVILCYVFMLGFVPSAIRAAVMGIAVMSATLINRREDFATSVLTGAFIILLINPYSIFDTGFLLSFAAVTGIYLFAERFNGIFIKILPSSVCAAVAMSVSVNLMTFPITATVFNKINFVGIIANIIIVPFLEALFIGGMLVAVIPFAGHIIALPLKAVAKAVLFLSDLLAEMRFLNISVMTPNVLMLAISTGVILFIFLTVHRKSKAAKICTAAVLAVLTSAATAVQIYEYGLFRVEFINVGQGDSILISEKGQNFLIDTGRENSRDSLEYLKDRGIMKLGVLFITHADSDHSGGAKNIADNIEVEKVVLPYTKRYDGVTNELEEYFTVKGSDVLYASAGDVFGSENAIIRILMPDGAETKEDYRNNNSLVMAVEYKDKRFLMTGDAGHGAEKILLEKYDIKSDILKVGHHGSINSTSDEFLNEVLPEYAVISCGINHYGHPAEEVVSKLEKIGSIIYRTDENGNIVFKTDKKGRIKVGDMQWR